MPIIAGFVLILAAIALYNVPVGACQECAHCRRIKEAELRERQEANKRFFGIKDDED